MQLFGNRVTDGYFGETAELNTIEGDIISFMWSSSGLHEFRMSRSSVKSYL